MAEPVHLRSAIRFGPYTLDLSAGELHKNGTRIRLPEQPFQIIKLLLEHPGEVVTREELRQRLWSDDTNVDFETGLNSAVKKLRDVLGDSADKPHFIETLPRRGYRFIYPIDGAGVAVPSPTAWWHPRWVVISLLLIVLAVSGALLIAKFAGLRDSLFGPGAPPTITTVAVLPLENLTGDPGQEYLADGLTDKLTTVLARLSALRVPSRTSAMTFKGIRKPLREVARELRVDAVVEGTVMRAEAAAWSINIQLIYVPTDRHLWAKTYVHDAKSLSLLPEEVARDIISVTRIRTTPEEQTRVLHSRTVHPQAYEAYLRGDYYSRKRSREDLYKGIEYFRQAIDFDPTYAPAYDGLANCYWLLTAYSFLSPREAFPFAKAAALKAVELDDSLGSTHATLSRMLLVSDWDWVGAEREFQRARQLGAVWPHASFYLVATGKSDEAIALAKEAVEHDPLTPTTSQILAWVYFLAGRYDDSIAQLRKTILLDPRRYHPHDMLARNYTRKKMFTEAVAECNEALTLLGENDDPVLFSDCGWVFGKAGLRTQALKLDEKLRKPASQKWIDPLFRARIQLGIGNKEYALDLLNEAFRERSPDLVLLKASEIFGSELSTDPRFQHLLRRIGFPHLDKL